MEQGVLPSLLAGSRRTRKNVAKAKTSTRSGVSKDLGGQLCHCCGRTNRYEHLG